MTSRLAEFTRQALIDGWLAEMARAFPGQADRPARWDRDPFRNPVAAALRRATSELVDELTGNLDPGRLRDGLVDLVRLRALSDVSPEVSVALVRSSRAVFHRVLTRPDAGFEERAVYDLVAGRLLEVERLAAELFWQCRTDLCSIAARAARRRTFVADRAQPRALKTGDSEANAAPPGDGVEPK